MNVTNTDTTVTHVFVWKWSADYHSAAKKEEVFDELSALFDLHLLSSLTCSENCIGSLNLAGAGPNPKLTFSADFDAGLVATAKDGDSFNSWWASADHAAFMSRHPTFAAEKINLEWR